MRPSRDVMPGGLGTNFGSDSDVHSSPHGDADAGKEPYGRSGRLILETPSDAEASVEADSVVFPVMEPNMHDSQSDRSDLGIVGRTKSVDCPTSAIRTLDDRELFLFYGIEPNACGNGKRGGASDRSESSLCLDGWGSSVQCGSKVACDNVHCSV